ncbi:MAG: GNAT family N-acetyltransferase [Bacteriovoracaceae bacterium]
MMIKNFPEQISGPRLKLIKHDPSKVDLLAPIMFSTIDIDRDRLKVFLPWVNATKTVDDSKAYIQFTHEKWAQGEMFDYGMYVNDLFIGCVGFHHVNWTHECLELGCWLSKDFEGKGYLSEAIKLLEGEAFKLGFNRIEIRCSNKNFRSVEMAKGNQYILDGTLRQNAIEHGQFRDTHIFSKCKSDLL